MSIDRLEAIEDAAGFIGIEPDRMKAAIDLYEQYMKSKEASATEQADECDCEWFAYSDGTPYQRHRCKPTRRESLSLTEEERAKLKNIIQIATYEAKNGLHMGEAGRAADKVLDALSERYEIRRKG